MALSVCSQKPPDLLPLDSTRPSYNSVLWPAFQLFKYCLRAPSDCESRLLFPDFCVAFQGWPWQVLQGKNAFTRQDDKTGDKGQVLQGKNTFIRQDEKTGDKGQAFK